MAETGAIPEPFPAVVWFLGVAAAACCPSSLLGWGSAPLPRRQSLCPGRLQQTCGMEVSCVSSPTGFSPRTLRTRGLSPAGRSAAPPQASLPPPIPLPSPTQAINSLFLSIPER